MLIQAYLRHLPFELSFARTGREAIDRWQEQDPDLILMDVQMPEMDGLDATRLIRSQPGRRIPILALTADTQASTREACLQAGCDAILNKPIDQRTLLQALEEYLLPKQSGAALTPAPQATLLAGFELPIRRAWQRIAGMEEILPFFLEQRLNEPDRLADFLQLNDFDGIARLGHGMKGAGSSFGFDAITELGQVFEEACARQDRVLIEKLTAAYRDYLQWILKEMPVL